MPSKKGKTARFQVDQVGEKEDVIMGEEQMLTSNHVTQYHKSLRHYLTREVLPMENNYRNLLSFGRNSIRRQTRPTMEELRDEDAKKLITQNDVENVGIEKKKGNIVKLGWINGVYVRSFKV